jgi:(R,R)-butanediol dehydrogenase/meso-butanediol dehydrogenase/diacetyl reductase
VLADRGFDVVVFDIDEGRLAGATALGAGEVRLLPRDPAAAVGHLRDFGQQYDVVFETAGVASGWSSALSVVRRGGRMLGVGLPSGEIGVDAHQAVAREIDIVTSSAHVSQVDLPDAIELLARRSLAPLLVDRVIALDRIVPDGFVAMARREVNGKVIVRLSD